MSVKGFYSLVFRVMRDFDGVALPSGLRLIDSQYTSRPLGHAHARRSMDTFNEEMPGSNDPAYLRASNAAIFAGMNASDPKGTYVMQGWLFVNSPDFWTPTAVEAYLSGVPDDRMLVLDLFTEAQPAWQRYSSYFGKPWIWCQLQVRSRARGGRRRTPRCVAARRAKASTHHEPRHRSARAPSLLAATRCLAAAPSRSLGAGARCTET